VRGACRSSVVSTAFSTCLIRDIQKIVPFMGVKSVSRTMETAVRYHAANEGYAVVWH